jgi:hypothetical protein
MRVGLVFMAASVLALAACESDDAVTSPDPVSGGPWLSARNPHSGALATADGDSTDDGEYTWGRIKLLYVEDDGEEGDEDDDCDCGDGPIEW